MRKENVEKYKSVLERIIENPFRMLLLPANAVEAEIDDAKDDVLFQFGFGIPDGELPFELAEFEVSERNESDVNRTAQALATEEAANYRMFWFLKEDVPTTWNSRSHVDALEGEVTVEKYDAFLAAYMYCMLCEDVRAKEWFLVLNYLETIMKNGMLAEVARLRGIEPTDVFLQTIYTELCAIYQAYFVERANHDMAAEIFAVQEGTLENFRTKMRDTWANLYHQILEDWEPRYTEISDSIKKDGENSPEYKNVKADLLKYFPWALNDIVKLESLYSADENINVFAREKNELEFRYKIYFNYTELCYETDVVDLLKQLNSSLKYYELYKYYRRQNDAEEFMDALEKGTEAKVQICMKLYVSYLNKLGEFEKAWQVAEQMEQLDGASANQMYAEICEDKNDLHGAIKYFKVAADVYGNEFAASDLVRVCNKVGAWEDAIKYAIYSTTKNKLGTIYSTAADVFYANNLWHKAAYAYMQTIRLEEVKYSVQTLQQQSWVIRAIEGLDKMGIEYSFEIRKFSAKTERGLKILKDALLYDVEDDFEDIDKRIAAVKYAAENGARDAYLKLYKLYIRKIACIYGERPIATDIECIENAKFWLAKAAEIGDGRLDAEEKETHQKILDIFLGILTNEGHAQDGGELPPSAWKDFGDWYYYHLKTLLPESEIEKGVAYRKALDFYFRHAQTVNYKMSEIRSELADCCEILNDYRALINVMSKCDVRRADILGMAHLKSGNYEEAAAWLDEINRTDGFETPLKAKYAIFAAQAFEKIGNKETARKAYNYASQVVDDTYYKIKYYAKAEVYRLDWNEENWGGVLRETLKRIAELRALRRKPIAYARLMQVAADIMRAQGELNVADMYQKRADEHAREFTMTMEQVWFQEVDREYLPNPETAGMSIDALMEMFERMLANEYWKRILDGVVEEYAQKALGMGAFAKKFAYSALKRAEASEAQRKYIDNALLPKLES